MMTTVAFGTQWYEAFNDIELFHPEHIPTFADLCMQLTINLMNKDDFPRKRWM